MKIQFMGAAKNVTGSCFLLSTEKNKFLVDCGLFQGPKEVKELNYNNFDFNPEEIDFVILTHAHIDHSGLIPKLVKHGFKGKVYCTPTTLELCKIMLPDSGYIQEMEVERKNRKNIRAGRELIEPIYTSDDAYASISYFVEVDYDKLFTITENIKLRLKNAGHILGSAIVELWLKDEANQQEKKIVFSGDLGDCNQPIIKDPDTITEADYLVIESTYGHKNRDKSKSKKEQLEEVIAETIRCKGNLIIPAFAIERTQDLLYYLNQIELEGKSGNMSMFVDSPLAISATEIFCKSDDYFDHKTQLLKDQTNACPILPKGIKLTRSAEESIKLNTIKKGAIIISASGMCEAGRIKHHLKHNLWRRECTILFVGYQAIGTLGRRIINGEERVRIHGEEIAVKAQIKNIEGFSAHADQNALINWIDAFTVKPRRIFVTHGEEQNSSIFAEKISTKFGIEAVVPSRLDVVKL
ncbi:metallo-beta-lactamase family protein [Desulfitispora alkaliphila]|uniref:MBL fold metallo-hydrolase RNA specificity domain-containing protein n=1 Tax=Desulfitispora alkaliphila TaxID=622674 RepID=UPI003D22FE2B